MEESLSKVDVLEMLIPAAVVSVACIAFDLSMLQAATVGVGYGYLCSR